MKSSDIHKMENRTMTMILSEDVPPLAFRDFKKYLFVSSKAYLKATVSDFENSVQSKAVNTLLKQYLADKQLSIMFVIALPSEDPNELSLSFITDLKSLHPGHAMMCFKQVDFGIEDRKKGFLRYFRKKIHVINLGQITNEFNPLQVARSYIGKSLKKILIEK
jgi:hypothetical protein